jgi:hypothetical protein
LKVLYPIRKYDRTFSNFSYYRFVENELKYTDARTCGRFLGYDYDNRILDTTYGSYRWKDILKDFEREMNEIRKANRK